MKLFLKQVFILILFNSYAIAEEGDNKSKDRKIMIDPHTFSVEILHKGEPVTIMRNQNMKNSISKYYQPTHRGKIQPMAPFKPHQVETIGALELIDYLKQLTPENSSLLVIDSRTKAWVKRGTIPGTINIPFTAFNNEESALEIMEDQFDVLNNGNFLDFTNAKTLVMYCNGIWCGQSPTAINKLLRFGYPAAKIKYFRGGMQNWESLGLTVVKP